MLFTDTIKVNNILLSQYIPFLVLSIFFICIFRKNMLLNFKVDIQVLKDALKYSSPLVIINLLNVLISSSDIFIIKVLLSSEDLGHYSFTYRTAELIMITLANFIILTFYPSLIKIYNSQGILKARLKLSNYFHIQLIISFPFLLLITVFSEEILGAFFKNYINSGYLFSLNLIGTFLFSLTFYTNKPYELSKNMKNLLKVVTLCALINISLNILLIPLIGVVGASFSTIASYFIYLVLSHYGSDKKLKLEIEYKKIFTIFSYSISFFCIIYFLFNKFSSQFILLITTSITFMSLYFLYFYYLYKKNSGSKKPLKES